MKTQTKIEDALALWDAVQDESEIYIPVVSGREGERNKIFVESIPATKEEKKKSLLRIFLNKDEADAYRIVNAQSKVSIAKTTMSYLLKYVDKHFRNSVEMEFQCVLSTIDMDGKFYGLDSIWSNNQIDN